MWVLIIIMVVNGGESPSNVETKTFPTLEACIHARTIVERNPRAHGYCSFEKNVK
jgi:hypothetical protein